MFSVHITNEKFGNATFNGHIQFVFEEDLVKNICHILIIVIVFEKLPFKKMFSVHTKTKSQRF